MFIMTAKQLDKMLKEKSSVDKTFLAEMHVDCIENYRENKNLSLSDEHIQEGIDFITNELDVILSKEQFVEILDAFPFDKILYIESEDTADLLTPVYGFIAGCEAPTYGDQVDSERIARFLVEQAKKLGYETLPQS